MDTRGILNGGLPYTNPGASSSVTIYDDGAAAGSVSQDAGHGLNKHFKIHVAAYLDQNFSLVQKWHPSKTGTPITWATFAGTASTALEKDIRLLPGRNQIVLTTVTNPTTFLVAAEYRDDAAVGTTS